jgi:hypothetical protein
MAEAAHDKLVAACQRFARMAGAVSAGVGALVLIGWAFDLPALKGVLPGFATMKANTALCFILAGGGLWFIREKSPAHQQRLGRILGAAVLVISALTLAQYLFGWDLRIDQLLFTAGWP